MVKGLADQGLRRPGKPCQPPKFSSDGSSTNKSQMKKLCNFQVRTDLPHSPIVLDLTVAKHPLEETSGRQKHYFRSFIGDFMYRHHKVHRSELYLATEKRSPSSKNGSVCVLFAACRRLWCFWATHLLPSLRRWCTVGIDRDPPACSHIQGDVTTERKPFVVGVVLKSRGLGRGRRDVLS